MVLSEGEDVNIRALPDSKHSLSSDLGLDDHTIVSGGNENISIHALYDPDKLRSLDLTTT